MRTPGGNSAVAPRPQDRKAETQERIVSQALALFMQRGFEGTSIQRIAERAGVSRSAVFWHFGDKESLFREAFRRMLVPFFGEIKEKYRHVCPEERIFALFDAYERVVEENEAQIRSIVRWLFESEKLQASLMGTLFALHDEFIRDVREALEELLPDARDAAPLAAAFVSLLDGNLLLTLIAPASSDDALRRDGLRIALRMLREGRGGAGG